MKILLVGEYSGLYNNLRDGLKVLGLKSFLLIQEMDLETLIQIITG